MRFDESDDVSSAHSIFIRKYRSEKKSSDKPIGKTLQVLNIPPYANEETLTRVFSVAGAVQKVTLIDSYKNEQQSKYQIKSQFFNEPLPFKFKIGFIVFSKSESLDVIFRLNELPALNCEGQTLLTGVAKWTDQYNNRMIDTTAMQTEIDEYMKVYDKLKQAGEVEGEADDDGWITVGKKGQNAGFKQKESVISKLEQKIRDQKKKAKNLTNFYSFELRESKKQQLMELRRKFEEDKLKMNSMKQNRKFKPYQ